MLTRIENIEESLDAQGFFIPKCVDYNASKELFKDAHITPKMREVATRLRANGWTFYAVNQTRGRCYYKGKIITIPVWALVRGISYRQWYISHEMAHAIAGPRANHGPGFMTALRSICPPEALHFELGYKPRNARAAAIVHPKELEF